MVTYNASQSLLPLCTCTCYGASLIYITYDVAHLCLFLMWISYLSLMCVIYGMSPPCHLSASFMVLHLCVSFTICFCLFVSLMTCLLCFIIYTSQIISSLMCISYGAWVGHTQPIYNMIHILTTYALKIAYTYEELLIHFLK
jgi:hypothetical protein